MRNRAHPRRRPTNTPWRWWATLLPVAGLSLASPAYAIDICIDTREKVEQVFTDCGDETCVWQFPAGDAFAAEYEFALDLPAAEHRLVGGYTASCTAQTPGNRTDIGSLTVIAAQGSARVSVVLDSLIVTDLTLSNRANPAKLIDLRAESIKLDVGGTFIPGSEEPGAPISIADSVITGPVTLRSTWKGAIALTGNVFASGGVLLSVSGPPRRVRVADNTLRNGFVAPGGAGAAGLTLDFGNTDVTATIRRNRFEDNWSWESGGALGGTTGSGSVDVDTNVFLGNGAWGSGGGVDLTVNGGGLHLLHNLFQQNVAATGNYGGGAATIRLTDDDATLIVANNVLRGNVADVFDAGTEPVGQDLAVIADEDGNGTDAAITVRANAIGTAQDSVLLVASDPAAGDNLAGPPLALPDNPTPDAAGLDPLTYALPRRSALIDAGRPIDDWDNRFALGGLPRRLGPAPDIGPSEAPPLALMPIGPEFGDAGWDHLAFGCRDVQSGVPGGCSLTAVDSVNGTATPIAPDLIRAGLAANVTAIVPVPPLADGARPGVAWLELDRLGGIPQTRLRVRDLAGNPSSRWLQTLPFSEAGELLYVASDLLAEPLLVTTGYIDGRIHVVAYEADAPLVDEFPLAEGTRWVLGPADTFVDEDAPRVCTSLVDPAGAMIVRCVDLATESRGAKTIVTSSGWRPLDLVNVGDLNGDGRGEALLLARRVDKDNFGFFTVDLAARRKLNRKAYSKPWQPLALAADPAGAPAAAFLAHRRSNGRPLQRMVDPQDGAFGGNRSAFASGWRGRAIAMRTAAGEAGSVEPESVALGIDSDSGAVIAERRDAAGRRLTRTVVVPPDPTTDPRPTQ